MTDIPCIFGTSYDLRRQDHQIIVGKSVMTTPNMSGLTPWKAVAAAYMRMRALAQHPYITLHESESRRCTMAGRTLNVEPTQDYPGLLKTPGKEESWTWPIFLWNQKGSQKEDPEKEPGLKRPWHRVAPPLSSFHIIFLNPICIRLCTILLLPSSAILIFV